MPNYDVHVYAVVRVKAARVEADSPQAAARQAEQSLDLHHLVAAGGTEYAEEIEGFFVDLLDETGQRIEGGSVFLDPTGEVLPE